MTNFYSELLTPDDKRWLEILSRVDYDIYHTPEYVRLCSNNDGGTPRLLTISDNTDFLVGSFIAIPLLIRSIDYKWFDAISPYGYPSPLGCGDIKFFSKIKDQLIICAEKFDLVSMFIRFNPLVTSSIPSEYLDGIYLGQTVVIEISSDIDNTLKNVRSIHLRQNSKLKRQGYNVIVDDWSYLDEFIDMYSETMNRVNASEYYFFNRDYFYVLKKELNEKVHLSMVINDTRKAIAGLLFFSCNRIIQYHLPATGDNYVNLSPSKMLILHLIEWGSANNFRLIQLGGGVGCREDSLYEFKSGFSPNREEFHIAKIILNHEVYNTLTAKVTPKNQDFFPAYRG
jgi:hypothetical protein